MTNPMDSSDDLLECCSAEDSPSLERLIEKYRSNFTEETIRHAFEQANGDAEETERALNNLRHHGV